MSEMSGWITNCKREEHIFTRCPLSNCKHFINFASNGVTLVQRCASDRGTKTGHIKADVKDGIFKAATDTLYYGFMRWLEKYRRPLFVHSVWRIGEAGTNTQTQIWRDRKRWPAPAWHFLYPMKMLNVSKHSTPSPSWCSVHFLSPFLVHGPLWVFSGSAIIDLDFQ